MTGEKDAPAGMPDDLVRKVIEIVEGAVNSAIPAPWEVSARASAAILALFAPILAEKERAYMRRWTAALSQAQEWRNLAEKAEARTLAAEAALAAERERCAKTAFVALESMRDEGENDIRLAQSRVDAAIRAQANQEPGA